MARDFLIDLITLSFIWGAIIYCATTLFNAFFRLKKISRKDFVTINEINLRAKYKTKIITRFILLFAITYLEMQIQFSLGYVVICIFILISCYLSSKGFTNIYGDDLTPKNLTKINEANLYLRPFQTDSTKNGLKIEKAVNRAFSDLAQVFSIGNPSSILPSLGSISIFAPDNKWKESVALLLERSKCIILRMGKTPGAEWEFSQCFNKNYLHKTIFIVDSIDKFNHLTQCIKENYGTVNLKYNNDIIACFMDYANNTWKTFDLSSPIKAKELFNEFIDTREKYKRDVEEFRERRKYFWKYIFNKKFFPKELRTFSLGFILNPFIYIAYNGWHSSVLYTILSVCVIQYFIFPYLHCPEVTASISSFIWILLFVIMLTLSILAPRISWLSRRWASYNYFIDDNMLVNLMLISSWGSIIVYCLVLNLCLTLFLRI